MLFAAVLLLLRDHRRLQAFTYTIGLAAILLLLLPLVPGLGRQINGARIWIGVGGFSFQPGEVAKIALVIAFAGYLVLHRDALALAGRRFAGIDLPRGRDLGPILAMWLVSLGILVFQRDLGSSLLFFGLFLVMLYVATERPGWLVVGTTLFAGGSLRGLPALRPRADAGCEGWLDPFADPTASARSSRGCTAWPGAGSSAAASARASPWRIPFSYSDFIVAAIGEELGLTGLMAMLLLYGLIVERALRTALICRDGFGKLMATGFGVVFALQVFVVVGGVTKLIPLTGLTTPFMSYGGSSMVANWVVDRAAAADQRPRPPARCPSSSRCRPRTTQPRWCER